MHETVVDRIRLALQTRQLPIVNSADHETMLQFNDKMILIQAGLPSWWEANRNSLYTFPGAALPSLTFDGNIGPPRGAIVAIGEGANVPSIKLSGDSPLLVAHDRVRLPASEVICEGSSAIILCKGLSSTGRAEINCRNGGLIYVGPDGLWAASVRLLSDETIAIKDGATGERIHPHGGVIAVHDHVWLGFESVLFGGAVMGQHSVLGARAVMRTEAPANCVCAGIPAVVVRRGITWTSEDRP